MRGEELLEKANMAPTLTPDDCDLPVSQRGKYCKKYSVVCGTCTFYRGVERWHEEEKSRGAKDIKGIYNFVRLI